MLQFTVRPLADQKLFKKLLLLFLQFGLLRLTRRQELDAMVSKSFNCIMTEMHQQCQSLRLSWQNGFRLKVYVNI